MSLYINNIYNRKSYDIIKTLKHQNKSKDTNKSEKKKQILVEKQGKYAYTYMVDEKGNKILLNKIPIDQEEKKKNSRELIKPCTANECKQQMYTAAIHKKNLKEIIDLIKESVGIPSNHNEY